MARTVILEKQAYWGRRMHLFQQCAEKALQDFPALHDFPISKTQSIQVLVKDFIRFDPGLATLLVEAHLLTPYNGMFRYPGEDVTPVAEAAKGA